MCTSAHHGIMSGDPIQEIWVQSKVKMLMPSPELTPNTWLRATLLGAIHATKENTDSAWKRKPSHTC